MKKFLLFTAAAIVAAGASAETKTVLAEMYPGAQTLIGWGTDGLLENVTVDGRDCLKITNTEAKNSWEVQFAYDTEFVAGTTYYITMDVKGDAGSIGSGFQQTNGYKGCGNFNNFTITSDWNTVTIKGTAETSENGDPNRWVASVGDYVGTFYISNMSLYTLEEGGETPVEPGEKGWVSIINGGIAADGTTSSILAGWNGDAQVVANPAGEGVVYECPIAADPSNPWDSQLFITFNEALQDGAKIKVSFDYYCTDDRSIETQAQGDPGAYHYWQCIGTLSAGPMWQKHTAEVNVTADFAGSEGFKTIAFNLASAPAAATFYINNVVVEKEVDVPNAVMTIETVKVPAGVYNLNGVKVLNSSEELNSLPKGIYIVNGKKVVRK